MLLLVQYTVDMLKDYMLVITQSELQILREIEIDCVIGFNVHEFILWYTKSIYFYSLHSQCYFR